MTENEKIRLWTNEDIARLNNELTLVRNIYTGKLMIKRISHPSVIDTMRMLCGIRNRYLMEIYDAEIIGGMCVTLSEYVEGNTLASIIEHRGVFSEDDTKKIISAVCFGLKSLHEKEIVHRDINPNNVMLDNRGNIKIIDFDISRTVKDHQSHDTEIMGTPGYTAPEQFGFMQTDEKADIYSCGAMMNFLLTGKLPNEQMYSGSLTHIILRCIELDPKNRYENIDHLRAVLTNESKYLRQMGRAELENLRFRPLPGFRSKHFFPKFITTIAIIFYFLGLFSFVLYIFSPDLHTKNTPEHTLALSYFAVLVFGFFSLFPYLLFGDVGKYSLRLSKDLIIRKRLNRLFGWLCILAGIVLLFLMADLNSIGILDL